MNMPETGLPKLVMIPRSNGAVHEALCVERDSDWYGWLFHKHPDGQWVSWRKTGENERKLLEEAFGGNESVSQ